MARPLKQGLDYFFLSVDFLDDIKVRKIMRACGAQSIAVLISLLSRCYRFEGYYMQWDDDARFLVADHIGAKESLVQEIVEKAVSVGFFDADLYKEQNILTSHGIQRRFFEAASRRKSVDYDSSFMLNFENVNNNAVNVSNNSINASNNEQRREEESREENICIKSGKPDGAFLGGAYEEEGNQPEGNAKPEEEPPSYDAVVSYLNEKAGTRYLSSSKATRRLIHARWKEGFRLKEFETAIDKKVAEWKGTDMEQYLRPATLFGTKFESYLNQPFVKAQDRQNKGQQYRSDNVGNFEQRQYEDDFLDSIGVGPGNLDALDRMLEHNRQAKEGG